LLIGGFILRFRDQGLFRLEQLKTCVEMSVYRKRQSKAGMDSRASLVESVFSEGDKKRQEWAIISAGSLLSWP
jgi:hypothetical protein